jgi:hypothetical protein
MRRAADVHGSVAPGGTPTATKIALVATLCITAAITAAVVGRTELGPRDTAAYLLILSVLFLLRVAGQVAVALRAPSWLPPMGQWHLVPYRLLLPIQIGFLALMALIEIGFFRAWGSFVDPEPAFGRFLIGFSFVYAGAMILRYAVRMHRRPGERWFGGAIPIIFHVVLAVFLFTLGKYHVSG